MAFVQWSDIREVVAVKVGRYYTGTANSASNTTTALVDDDLAPYPDDFFNRLWIVIESGNNDGEVRYIADYVNSTKTISWSVALGAAAQQSVSYSVYQYNPNVLLRGLARAVRNLFPHLSREIKAPIAVGGSPIINPSFEWFGTSDVPDGWSAVSVTCAKQQPGFNSPYAVELTGTGSLRTFQTSRWGSLMPLLGTTPTFKAVVKSSAASTCRLALDDGTGTITNGSYHTGDDVWRTIEVSAAIPTNSGNPQLYIKMDLNNGTDIDMVWVDSGHGLSRRIFIPTIFPSGPSRLWVDSLDPDDPEKGVLRPLRDWTYHRNDAENADVRFDWLEFRHPHINRVIWAEGTAPLTVPTTLTSTSYVEISQDEVELLATEAAIEALNEIILETPSRFHGTLREQQGTLTRAKNLLMGGFGTPSSSADLPLSY